jgi:hypothetical protein
MQIEERIARYEMFVLSCPCLFLCYCDSDLYREEGSSILFSVLIFWVVGPFVAPLSLDGLISRISLSGVSVSTSQGKKKIERKELWYRGTDMRSQRSPLVKPSVKVLTTFPKPQAPKLPSFAARTYRRCCCQVLLCAAKQRSAVERLTERAPNRVLF